MRKPRLKRDHEHVFQPWFHVDFRCSEGDVSFDEGSDLWLVYVRPDGESRFRLVGQVSASFARKHYLDGGEGFMMDWMNQFREGIVQSSKGVAAVDEKFAKSYPRLFDLLTVTTWGEGEVRTPSSLLLFCEDGAFKMCITERDLGYTLWSTGQTFLEALQTLEKRLNAPTVEWRKQRQLPGKGKR